MPAAPSPRQSIISGPLFATIVYVIGPGGWSAAGNSAFNYSTGFPDRPSDLGSIARAGSGDGGIRLWPVPVLGAIDSGLKQGRATAGDTLAISGAKFDIGGLALEFCTANRSICVQSDPPRVVDAAHLTVDVPELLQDSSIEIWASNWGGAGQAPLPFTYFRRTTADDPHHSGELVREHMLGRVTSVPSGSSEPRTLPCFGPCLR